MLTINLLTLNNGDTIEKTLISLMALKGNILVADIGSTDDTIKICESYNAKVFKVKFNDDFSKVRNFLIKKSSDYIFSIHPWETLLKGQDILNGKLVDNVYQVITLQNNIINKEIRLFSSKFRYKNPVFETVDVIDSKPSNILITSHPKKKDWELETKIISEWKKQHPLLKDTLYYETCIALYKKEYKEFINLATHYFFLEKENTSTVIMLHYYYALINFYVFKNYQEAINKIIPCIILNPTMAEFWCLLGDIFYQNKKYEKAYFFYENGKILGSCRKSTDDYPMEIIKYKKYPEQMMRSCLDLLKNYVQLINN